MEIKIGKQTKYTNILNRIQNQFSIREGLYLIIRLYLTNNVFFYIIAILLRFVPILLISGNNVNVYRKNSINQNMSFHLFLKTLTCLNITNHFNFSVSAYILFCFIIYILFIVRVINYLFVIKRFRNKNVENKNPAPHKFQIILDHIVFLIFPYIIEYLSFSYYIYIFPNDFIIKLGNRSKLEIIVIIFVNTILIVGYNFCNYVFMISSNKKYTTSELEAYLRIKNEQKYHNNKYALYKCSNIIFYNLILFQNFALIHTIEDYFDVKARIYYKIIITIILTLNILFIILKKLYEYNYFNIINLLVDVLIYFCLYTIIIDLILFLSSYETINSLLEIINILQKLVLSLITSLLIKYKVRKHLESKIRQIIFQENNIKNHRDFLDAFLYLNEIMIKLKEKNDSESKILLLKFLYKHINICNKLNCNCKLLNIFIKNEYDIIEKEKEENNISYLITIMNYLYESAFLEYDYYNRYELTILLAEHYCHMKDNPIMAFSFISTLISNYKNKFSKFQMVGLYELSQKYIYYIQAKERLEKDNKISEKQNDFESKNQRVEFYYNYFNSLKLSYKVKKIICNYIDNLIYILKYKNIFEETLIFKFDENNENIVLVKINFFERNSNIENNIDNPNKKLKRINQKIFKLSSNLYKIIYLLKMNQLYYINFAKSIANMDIFKDIPIFIIFKYYLFFDIFEGGKIPQEISKKLYFSISNKRNVYNNTISNNTYNLLKTRYNEQYNKNDSRFFAIYEYKKDLRTKYFSEECALRLGFKQKDLINKKIDELMPKEFSSSHQNIMLNFFIGSQLKYFNIDRGFLFDKTTTVIYSIAARGSLIYNLAKNLIIISESTFEFEDDYKFMLNNNFEILSITKNFEDEYLLNQKIFHKYDLKIMEILQVKPEKLRQKFEKEFKIINYQNLIRQVKPEEYFIPQLYVQSGEANNGMFNHNNFINTKNQILSNVSKTNNNDDKNINETINDTDEKENLIKKEKIKKEIIDSFINPGKISLHNTFSVTLNKWKFIENIFKELTKIPDNELLAENNNNNNLITDAKKLINKLLTKNELANNIIRITFKLSYYYNKAFYFVSINDEKKLYLKLSKNFNFENSKVQKNQESSQKNITNKLSQKNIIQKPSKIKVEALKLNNIKNSRFKEDKISKKIDEDVDKDDNKTLYNKILVYKEQINKEKFIFIIKMILTFIILFIFVVYILLIYIQGMTINTTEKILLAFYYNTHTRDIIQDTLSKLNGIYIDSSGINPDKISNSYEKIIIEYSKILREKYHYFNKYFLEYNLVIGHDFKAIYEEQVFYRLKGFWKETPYYSKYSSEIDFLIHFISSINVTDSPELQSDLKNFLFFSGNDNAKEKVHTSFIRLLYYLTVNFENSYRNIFAKINTEIYTAYIGFMNSNNLKYYTLEFIGLVLYLIFFVIILIYLYHSNIIIIKNIIFLFLDFTEEHYSKNRNTNDHLITLKLLKFKYLIDDFDLNGLHNYFEELDNINKKKDIINEEMMNKTSVENDIINKNKKLSIDKEVNKSEILKKDMKEKKSSQLDKINPKKIMENIQNDNNSKLMNNLQKIQLNNSSFSYLVGNDSKFLKNNLNPHSFSNGELIAGNAENNPNKNAINDLANESLYKKKKSEKNNPANNELEIIEDFQDAILNKSNKSLILEIKKYIIIILVFAVFIVIYTFYKMNCNSRFNSQSERFYIDFQSIADRYSILYYYFNTLKALFLFNENDDRWEKLILIMEDMSKYMEEVNNNYNYALINKLSSYKEVENLFTMLQYNKNDSSEYLKETLCKNISSCQEYLDSNDNIFKSGIDFGYKTCFTYMENIFMDYKKIKNKTNVTEIIKTITGPDFYELKRIRLAFSSILYYIQQKIYSSFEFDQLYFRISYKTNISILNILSLFLSILTLLFVYIVIFISVTNFGKPIKESTYRINQSFYHIKKYNRIISKKRDSIILS